MTDAELEELKAGLAGVTPGPWNKCGGATPSFTAIHAPGYGYVVFGMADANVDREHNSHGPFIKAPDMTAQQRNARHIARCSPDKIASLIARLEAAEGGWQPIETAPKDGTRLWLFYPTTPEDDRQKTGWWEDDTCDGPRWMDHADSEQSDPTYWRPLPAPPAKSEG